MKLSERLLIDYAKKILGFACEKTGNPCEAEDLAQEIMLQLISCMKSGREIEHISSFIYTVCCYTWSKYLRSNKRHWNCTDIDEISDIADTIDIEQETEDRILGASLRRAISRLARTQREIILMYYYENRTTSEISDILNVNDNTIRWYLGTIRKDLKEKITMSEQNLNLRPKSMSVGIDGWIENYSNLEPLQQDLLVQNIALACYGSPLTITEISEKLNVAAAYLESHLEKMVYLDFLKEKGKKYQTNFFIKTGKIQQAEINYGYHHARAYADRLLEAVMERKENFLAIDYFNRKDINTDDFLWYMILKTAQELAFEQMEKRWEECRVQKPMRKDGSEYWVIANLREDILSSMPEDMKKYSGYRICNGYKWNENNFGMIHQADTALSEMYGINYRTADQPDRLLKLMHVILSIRDKKEMTEYEKLLMAEFIKEEYITMKNGTPVINVPVLNTEQMGQVQRIVDEIKNTLGHDFLKDYIQGFGSTMEPLIPGFLDKNLRNYHKYAVMGGFDLFAHLIKEAVEGGTCSLTLPDQKRAKSICTILVLK